MNRQIRQLALGLMACYVLLFVALNYWQVGRKPELDARFDNTRQVLREFNKPRGPIITADGQVAAVSTATPGERYEFRRDYPTADLLADISGYFTFAFGATQAEREYGEVLTGSTTEQQVRSLGDLLSGEVGTTGTVELAVRADAQEVAKFLLGGRTGSVSVIEPQTGAIRAMYSNPTYDPNTFVNEDFELAQQTLTELQNDPGDPLLAQAYQERYMPGSTFKVITTGIALESGLFTLDNVFAEEREWVPPQTNDPIQNYNGSLCGGDLSTVFALSCNIPFAQMSTFLGPVAMVEGTKAWGMGEPVPIDLPRPATSTFGATENLAEELPLLAIRGFGQSEVQMVPLHMAMVAGAVANGGQMMEPYAVQATYDQAGRVLEQTSPSVWKTPLSPTNAGIMTQLMVGVAERGTASCCIALEGGIPVAAKTGTAQLGVASNPDLSHAWIIAFAPADNPRYAVSVVLTNVQSTADVAATGGRLAGPIAKGMLDYLLTGAGSQPLASPNPAIPTGAPAAPTSTAPSTPATPPPTSTGPSEGP